MSYDTLILSLLEHKRVIIALCLFGFILSAALWWFLNRYDEFSLFIKERGHRADFTKWQANRVREKRIKNNQCPDHGYLLSRGTCPICDYQKDKGE